MKNRIVKFIVLFLLLIPFNVFAEEYSEFMSDDESVYFVIYGDDASSFQNDDYEINDITDDVFDDTSLIDKINEYGTLIKAIEMDLNVDTSLENYYTYLDIFFDYSIDMPHNLGCLVLDNNGNLIPATQFFYSEDDDTIYYEFVDFLYAGKIFFIDPIEENYQLEDSYAKVQFDYYKYKQYDNDSLIFGSISRLLENADYAKDIATSKGLNYDAIFKKNYDYDYVPDELSLYVDSLYEQLSELKDGRKFLDIYGMFFINKLVNTYESADYLDTTYNIGIKVNDTLSDYSDFAVYKLDFNGINPISSGEFSDQFYYYTYDSENDEYIPIFYTDEGYMIGDLISSDDHILEFTGQYNYREVTTEYFTYWGDHWDSYYTYDGENYNHISDYNVGDRIADYGQKVYILDDYKVTDDEVFQDGKSYAYECGGSEGSYCHFSFADFKLGDSISEYISKTGNQVYKEDLTLVLAKNNISAQDGYINFTYVSDPDDSIYPIFIVCGKKNVIYNPISSDSNFDLKFSFVDGLTMTLNVDNIKQYSSSDINEIFNGVNVDATEIINKIKHDLIKDSVIDIYNITVNDNNGNEYKEGPFDIRIKISDSMSNYKDFNLTNIQVDNASNIVTRDVVSLSEEDGYLVGTLPHLSVYALSGTLIEDPKEEVPSEKNGDDDTQTKEEIVNDVPQTKEEIVNDVPQTVDNILIYVISFVVSAFGLCALNIYIKKNRRS